MSRKPGSDYQACDEKDRRGRGEPAADAQALAELAQSRNDHITVFRPVKLT